MLKGSCLCGAVQYQLKSQPKAITDCDCSMCRKQHGAAYATYGSVPKQDLIYLSGEEHLSSYQSSAHITRKFCSVCGSNIEWSGSPQYPDWVSVTISTLDQNL